MTKERRHQEGVGNTGKNPSEAVDNLKRDQRHEARRIALAVLFSWHFFSGDTQETEKVTLEQLNITKYDKKLSDLIINGTIRYLDEIDKIIGENAPDWSIKQIDRVELICLRIAIFELLFTKKLALNGHQVPMKVAIDEAIELAKEFGEENSGSFVNGVLGTVVKKFKI